MNETIFCKRNLECYIRECWTLSRLRECYICCVFQEMPYQSTGRRTLIGCLKLQVIFRKRATNYRKMIYEDNASYDSTPPCTGRLILSNSAERALSSIERALISIERALISIKRAHSFYPKSHNFCQKSPRFYQKSPMFYQKRTIFYQESPIVSQESPAFDIL